MSDDFAALMADTAATADTTTETSTIETETHVADETTTAHDDAAEQHGETAEVSGQDTDKQTAESDSKVDGRTLPDQVRKGLKAFRDSDPANAKLAKELNDQYGRALAYKEIFPTVSDAKAHKAEWDAIGGREGLLNMRNQVNSVRDTDQKLYAGDPSVVTGLYADMKAAGKAESFTKLAPAFLDLLSKNHPEAYEAAMGADRYQFLESNGFGGAVTALAEALKNGDTKTAQSIVQSMVQFNSWLKQNHGDAATKRSNPEKEAWEKEREEFRTNQTKEFQKSVGSALGTDIRSLIAKTLKPYTANNPYFKAFSNRMLNDLGSNLFREVVQGMEKDSNFKSQMQSFWSESKPSKEKIQAYNKQVAEIIVPKIIREVLDRDYNGYAKKGAVKAAEKKAAPANTGAAQAAPTTAVYVPREPSREDIDWNKPNAEKLYIGDVAFSRSRNKWVTWNAKFAPKQ